MMGLTNEFKFLETGVFKLEVESDSLRLDIVELRAMLTAQQKEVAALRAEVAVLRGMQWRQPIYYWPEQRAALPLLQGWPFPPAVPPPEWRD